MASHTSESARWPVVALWRNRSLLMQFTLRNINVRHKGSYLGVLWQVLTPLLMLALYSFTFGVLLHGHFGVIPNETSADYALGIFMGFTLYGLVADCLGAATNVVVENANLVKKVRFPLEILPASMALSVCYSFLISMILFVIGFCIVGPSPTWLVLWLPVVLFPLLLLSLGVCWFLGAMGVYFRDVQNAMMFITTALFYMSGIFYSSHSAGAGSKARVALEILRWNPIFVAIETSRDVTLWGVKPDMFSLAYLYVVCALVFVLGFKCFQKMKTGFADVL
ncbi:MAG: ABC transporter permease [Opitutales bacterium]|jgi:lipopolysaccharide transport system permease protein